MIKLVQTLPVALIILIATILEVSGDALVRKAIYNYEGWIKTAAILIGAVLLLGYGYCLNLAPVEFSKIAGLYIATLFIVWQTINYLTFKTLPDMPILIGGALIITGGFLVTFWKP